MKQTFRKGQSGTTLVELIVSMGVFLVFMAIAIPTFIYVNKMFGEIQTKQELNKKGQRALDYMAEEIRLAGLFVGARPQVPFCTINPPFIDSLEHTAGDPFDTLTFLTSEQVVTTTAINDELGNPLPFLTIRTTNLGPSDLSPNILSTYASGTAQISGIVPRNAGNALNARSFITFDTVQPTAEVQLRVYQVTTFGGSQLTITPNLMQQITKGSNVYSVVRKRFSVDADRNLQRIEWDQDCNTNTMTQNILNSHDRFGTNLWGGVDALQFEYVLADGTVEPDLGDIANPVDIRDVRAINIWLLLKADFPENDYTNTTTYTVGSPNLATGVPITVGPRNDHFRRVLLSKRVEVKNLEK